MLTAGERQTHWRPKEAHGKIKRPKATLPPSEDLIIADRDPDNYFS